MVTKLLYYVVVHLDLVVATRKSFDVTSIYKSLFSKKMLYNHFFTKLQSIAAANNLPVHALAP